MAPFDSAAATSISSQNLTFVNDLFNTFSGGSISLDADTSVVTYRPSPSKIYASCTLTSDKSGSAGSLGAVIIGADGLTDQLSSSTLNVIQSNVTYAGFKAPRNGIYNVSVATYVVASIGGVELHTKLRNDDNTNSTILYKWNHSILIDKFYRSYNGSKRSCIF